MQAVVVKKFRDKNTNQIMMPGMKITVTTDRLAEINSTDLFAVAVGENPAASAAPVETPAQSPVNHKKPKGGKKNGK